MGHFIYGVAICLAPVRKNLDVLARYGVRINNAALKGQVNGFFCAPRLDAECFRPNDSDGIFGLIVSCWPWLLSFRVCRRG